MASQQPGTRLERVQRDVGRVLTVRAHDVHAGRVDFTTSISVTGTSLMVRGPRQGTRVIGPLANAGRPAAGARRRSRSSVRARRSGETGFSR